MSEGLPKGLIATNENVSTEIEREDRVALEDIAKLWRGISVPPHAIVRNKG